LNSSSRSPSNTPCFGSVLARAGVPSDIAVAARGCSEIAAELCGRQRPPGLSVAVVKPGAVWNKGFGLADLEAPDPADADTVYLWFSMTKLVTATAVLQLADRGQLDLDRPVASLVPDFPRRDGGSRVTSRHLLSHSAGLANPIPIGWVHPAHAPAEDLDAFTARLLRKHSRLRGEPGKRASYSNLGYLVLGEVVEAAGGVPYVDYMRAQILEPLGMTTTDFMYRADMTARAATGYHPRFRISTPMVRIMTPPGIFDHPVGRFWALSRFCVDGAPYGGLIGSVTDAARFLALHVDPGAHRDVLSEAAVIAMRQATAHGRQLDVGLGWFRRRSDPPNAGHYWEHLGGGGGFFNTMRVYPELQLGLVAMGNATEWDHLRLVAAATQAPSE
jgi:CubicO group peptidase (beta-lactamase class C family)